jgi:hypothetical protein
MSQQRYFFGVCVAILTVFSGFKAGAAEPRPIDGFDDNSFLVEEAYNQDRGEVQHTLNAVYSNDFKRRGWSLNFEQEWWLFTEDHQVAVSVPFTHLREEGERQRGVGDIEIEYRYQLTKEGRTFPPSRLGSALSFQPELETKELATELWDTSGVSPPVRRWSRASPCTPISD